MKKPTYISNLGRAPTWEGPSPTQEPTTRRQSRAGPTQVRAHQGCGRTPAAATWAQLPLTKAWRHAMTVLAGFLIYLRQTDHVVTISMGGALFQHTPSFGATHLTSLLVLFQFLVVVFGASKSYLGELVSLEEKREGLGMNTKGISSIVMLSYHLYSCAIELE